MNDVQAVEYLSLVLVDPLHVDVKDGPRVYLHTVLFLQILCKLQLVLLRNTHQIRVQC